MQQFLKSPIPIEICPHFQSQDAVRHLSWSAPVRRLYEPNTQVRPNISFRFSRTRLCLLLLKWILLTSSRGLCSCRIVCTDDVESSL